MSPSRSNLLADIATALDGRPLVWFGTRGDDVASDLPGLAASFSIISRHDRSTLVEGEALEDHTGFRVDLDAHDIDDDPFSEPLDRFRGLLLDRLSSPCAVITYRPSTFLSAACFARRGRARYLGMFKDHQQAFEHKPWVETQVADLGVPMVPWRYVSDRDRHAVLPLLDEGPLVLRRSRSSGGTGVHLVTSAEELESSWPHQDEAFASVAPYLDATVPVNVGAVVWDDGDVTVDYPSVQLIGVPNLTTRRFGYCGNDFVAVQDLPDPVLDQVEDTTTRVGRQLGLSGYRGAFGVDFLVKDEQALFIEVNPRFQGSTHASIRLGGLLDQSCVMTDHLAALLGIDRVERAPLRERVRDMPALAHLVCHHLDSVALDTFRESRLDLLSTVPGFLHADVLAPSGLDVERGATVARFTYNTRLTDTGFDIVPAVSSALSRLSEENDRG